MKITPAKPHFFKPIQSDFKQGLKIPVGFLKYLMGYKNEYAILRKDGKKWLVKVNGRRLQEGWGKFAEEQSLELGDMLVFRHEGNMEFEVTIFDSSHCDREYAEYLLDEEEANKVEFKDFRLDHGWLINFRRNLNDWEVDRHLSLLDFIHRSSCSSSPTSDCLIWTANWKGTFSVKSCYAILTQSNPLEYSLALETHLEGAGPSQG